MKTVSFKIKPKDAIIHVLTVSVVIDPVHIDDLNKFNEIYMTSDGTVSGLSGDHCWMGSGTFSSRLSRKTIKDIKNISKKEFNRVMRIMEKVDLRK